MPDMLSPHFSHFELACRCGCGLLPSPTFIQQLEDLRTAFAHPMPITSAARCPAHNTSVSTTGDSGPHIPRGDYCAVDVAISGSWAWHLVEAAVSHHWYGIGLRQHGPHAKRIVHLDNHWSTSGIPRPRVWTYPS